MNYIDVVAELAIVLNGECAEDATHVGISADLQYDAENRLEFLHMACAECLEVLNAPWQAEQWEGVVIPTERHYGWNYIIDINRDVSPTEREALDYLSPKWWTREVTW